MVVFLYVFFFFFFFFFDLGFQPFQEYFSYSELIVHQSWAKTGKPGLPFFIYNLYIFVWI